MFIDESTRRRTCVTLAGGTLTLALALTGCGSDSGPATGSGSVSRPTSATNSPVTDSPAPDNSATGSPAAEPTTSGGAPSESDSTGSGASLASLLLKKSDLPSSYGVGATSTLDGEDLNAKLRSCTGVPSAAGQIVGTQTSPSFSYTYNGASSTVTRYRTQQAADADTELLSAPKAKQCFRTVLLAQFNSSGSKASSVMVSVQPGTNNGPKNEAGIVRVSFVQDQGREGRPTIRLAFYYLTGPRVLSSLALVSFGNPFDQALSTKLLYTVAKRTAGA